MNWTRTYIIAYDVRLIETYHALGYGWATCSCTRLIICWYFAILTIITVDTINITQKTFINKTFSLNINLLNKTYRKKLLLSTISLFENSLFFVQFRFFCLSLSFKVKNSELNTEKIKNPIEYLFNFKELMQIQEKYLSKKMKGKRKYEFDSSTF